MAVVAVRPPWYRRILGRNPRAMAAGERPRSMGARGQPRPSRLKRVVLVLLVLVIVLPIVGYFTVPAVRQQIDGLLNKAGVAFTTFRNPSGNALDGNVGTVWLADATAGAPTLTVTFPGTTSLAGMIFQIGAEPGPDYGSHARPRQVELSFPGETQTVLIDLQDDPGPQERCLNRNHDVATFNIKIVSVYPSGTGGQNLVGLREVEFISGSC